MIFTSIQFWAAFIAFLILFVLLRRTRREVMMLYVIAASLAFFYLSNRWLMLLLPATALISWALTNWMSRQDGSKRRALLFLIIVLDLLPLLFFKYAQPLSEVFQRMLTTNYSLASIALPIGISFYTFQAISYSVDVYRRDFRLAVTFPEYLLYLSFFPLLLAGPITRADTFFPQIRRGHLTSERLLYKGLWLVILGITKKAIVADYLTQYNDWIFTMPDAYSGFECLMGLLGFSMQIYLDFSGYSDISIGIAAMLGIRLRENFCFPYRSRNLTDFWHRWHISLSTWLRDYIYIPLGGNRKGKFRTYLNNFLTMLIGGLWHGASWKFVFWGAMHGGGLIVHKMCRPWRKEIPDTWPVKAISWLLTMTVVTLLWVFFRADSFADAAAIVVNIFTTFDLAYAAPFFEVRYVWCIMMVLMILTHALPTQWIEQMGEGFVGLPWLFKLVIFVLTVQLVLQFMSADVTPFIYNQF